MENVISDESWCANYGPEHLIRESLYNEPERITGAPPNWDGIRPHQTEARSYTVGVYW